jgi:hypothetical protein
MAILVGQRLLLMILFTAMSACVVATLAYMTARHFYKLRFSSKRPLQQREEEEAHPFAWRTRL